MEEEKSKRITESFVSIIITEAIFVAIILLCVFIIKCFFIPLYGDVKTFYKNEISEEISINEVIPLSGGEDAV